MRTIRAGLQAITWLWLCLMHAPLCHAQSDERSREPTEYRETIDEALREFDAQHFEEARSLFLHAHRLYPNARTHRALGLVEYELRNYIDSVIHLEVALASDTKRLNDAQRSETERVLSRAHKFVGRFMLQLRPSTSELTLDGKQIDARPDTPLLLGIGEHQLQVRAEGFEPQQRALDIKGGERETLTILLSAAHSEPIAAHSPATNDSAPGARRWYRSPWLWTGVAIVLAGAAVGTAYAVTRDAGGPEVQRGSSGIVVHGP